ncbi:putative adenylate kinase 7, mitochondrial [Drosera capensis]
MAGLSRRLVSTPLNFHRSTRRGYAAAAAAQMSYDLDYDIDDQLHHRRRGWIGAMEDGEGYERERGVQWVVLGEPGAKKHVYAEWLSELLDVPRISTGTLVRQLQSDPRRSSIYQQIENAVNQGKLVPEDIIFELLSKRLEEGYRRGENGFILDGIPRTLIQAEILDEVADIHLVLNLKHSDDGFVRGHLGSGTEGSQIRPFSLGEEAVMKEKLRTYEEQGKALEDYYRKQRKLLDFQVGSTPGETWQGLLAALHLPHMSSQVSTHKLSA